MPGMQILRSISDHDAKYYPERLGRLFIINTPSIFTRVWNMFVKKWVDKGILEKVHILGKEDYKSILLQHIDAESLPEFLGGKCTCSHMPGGCVPIPRQMVDVKSISTEPILNESATLKDTSSPHFYEVTVPMEELVELAPKLSYRFKSTKKVSLEVRHRKWGSDQETVVIAPAVFESHVSLVSGQVKAQPGFYTFIWKKASKGLTLTATSVSYAVDLEFEEVSEVENVLVPSVEQVKISSVGKNDDEDDDDDDFADAEEDI
jgi:hypothetical protein